MSFRAQQDLIESNLRRVQETLLDAAAGRSLRLVCVTKYARLEWVEMLLAAGATELGENLLPDAAERFSSLTARGLRFTRHLIGPPQSRKIRLIPANFDWLQALERMKTAEMLSDELQLQGRTMEVLLQVNIGREAQKHGFMPEEAPAACEEIVLRFPRLKLRGLMVIPPGPEAYGGSAQFEQSTRGFFRQTRELFDRIREQYGLAAAVDTLSMGMSQDFTWAAAEGATMVRVGSLLFQGLEG